LSTETQQGLETFADSIEQLDKLLENTKEVTKQIPGHEEKKMSCKTTGCKQHRMAHDPR